MSGEATIRRGVRNARYAAIPNHVFEDVRLSMEARWLLGYLLSKPENWTVVIGDIIKKGNCGRDKARKMVAELVELGYAEREQARADGKFGATMLVIFDEPREQAVASGGGGDGNSVAFLPQTEMPAPVTPSPVLPAPVKSAHSNNLDLVNTDYQEERERERETRVEERASIPGTAEFRKRLQRFLSGDGFREGEWPKWASNTTIDYISRNFEALSEEDRKAAEGGRDAFLAKCRREGGKVMGAGNYFRDRVWEVLSERDRARSAEISAVRSGSPQRPDNWAPAYGPAHAAMLFRILCGGPDNPAAAPSGGLWFSSNLRTAWPTLVGFWQHTDRLGGLAVTDRDLELSRSMRFVPADSESMAAWRSEIKRRGLPDIRVGPTMTGAYFPAGGPEAFEQFEREAMGYGHDDEVAE